MFSILVIDDEPDNFDVIETFLGDQSYQLHYAASGSSALESLDIVKPDLILLDVMMPGMDGIEVCRRVKAHSEWKAIPVIIVTALSGKKDLAQCLVSGADDFISKPVNRLELDARVRSMLRIRQQYQQLATFNARLEVLVQQRTEQLKNMIFQDALTNLPSRMQLLHKLAEILAPKVASQAMAQPQDHSVALVYLDCDQFQLVNGSFGHEVGNRLLLAIADRLRQYLNENDLLARIGEDEFCFLLHPIEDVHEVENFVDLLMRSFDAPFAVVNNDVSCDIFITVCIGVAFGGSGNTAEELLQDADTAMYQAKLRGKGSHQTFERQMQLTILNRLTLESDLQRAMEQQEFLVHYQPIVKLGGLKIAGFEALVRWQHPTRGLVSPAEFIPSMETTGLIVRVGMTVFQQACQQLHEWHRRGWSDLIMSINLSVRQFESPTLLKDIDRVIEETGVDATRLKLEITETAIMDNAERAITIIEQLRARHMQISIDDFGTGYSSLGYLYKFPVNTLKIDRSFVSQSHVDNRQYRVVDTIVSLGKQLGLGVIAQGIETLQQLEWLRQLGCEFGQGYLFSKPLVPMLIEQQFLGGTGTDNSLLTYMSQNLTQPEQQRILETLHRPTS